VGDDSSRRYQEDGLSGLPEEYRALIALAPKDVTITFTGIHNWKVEAQVSYEKNGRTFTGTSTRWMSQWNHSVQEWADAIAQVRGSNKGELA
jgi:hypothetical protein